MCVEWRLAAEWGNREKLRVRRLGSPTRERRAETPLTRHFKWSDLVVLHKSRLYTGNLGIYHLSVVFTFASRAEPSGGRRNWNKEQGDEY